MIFILYMSEQLCTKCNTPKSPNEFPKGRKQCYLCVRAYKNTWNSVHRNKNLDGSKLKHTPKYDLVGRQFGKLKVIKFLSIRKCRGGRLSFFLCRCDDGNMIDVAGTDLVAGKVKSCGCLIHEAIKSKHSRWTGYKGLSGSSWNRIERNSKNNRREKRRNLNFTITKEYVWNLFEAQHGKCALTGMDIILDVGSKTKNQTASLDRIDSSKGYVSGNVQWVHKDVNSMKMDFSERYFLELCRKVVEHKNRGWSQCN